MYLYPPRYKLTGGYEADRRNWIRIRRQEGIYYIYFYSETMQTPLNVRPSFSHEINVKSISGLLSLGYQIGAVLNRRTEILYQDKDVLISKECIKELSDDYIQIKGKNRHAVLDCANKLGVTEHHIPNTFLALYFRELGEIQDQSSSTRLPE